MPNPIHVAIASGFSGLRDYKFPPANTLAYEFIRLYSREVNSVWSWVFVHKCSGQWAYSLRNLLCHFATVEAIYWRKMSLFYDVADGNGHSGNYLTGVQIFYKWVKGENMNKEVERHSGNVLGPWPCVEKCKLTFSLFSKYLKIKGGEMRILNG